MRQQAQQEQAAEIHAQRAAEKERREQHVAAAKAKTEALNAQNALTLDRLESILRMGLCPILLLAGTVGDSVWLRGVLVSITALALSTLAVRISAGFLQATK